VKTGQKQHVARQIVQNFLDEMIAELGRGHRLEFREFGIFDVVFKKPRTARNPRTGELVQVPAKAVVHFKPGRLMKAKVREAINQKDKDQAPPAAPTT
jgi:nucleoid DNA-binding protein